MFISRIHVVAMTGEATTIDDASVADTILSVKQRVFASNPNMSVRRQRLMYRPGPHGINPLADDETLGGAGVARDGTAELDVLLVEELAAHEVAALSQKVRSRITHMRSRHSFMGSFPCRECWAFLLHSSILRYWHALRFTTERVD